MIADPAETIGQRLRVARTNAGMTGTKVANHLGVSVQQISNIENRGDGVGAHEVFGLADLLRVDARWLATGHQALSADLGITDRTLSIARALASMTDERREALVVLLGIKI